MQLFVAWILPVVSRCRKSLAVPLERRELLQIYASFNEKSLSAEWIWAATRQVEGKEVTQRSAVVADRWLLPSAESQVFISFSPPPLPPCLFLFILGERLLCAPCREEECIPDGGRNALWTGLGACSEQGA